MHGGSGSPSKAETVKELPELSKNYSELPETCLKLMQAFKKQP